MLLEKRCMKVALIFLMAILIPAGSFAFAQESIIPQWVKNTAGWWADGLIEDSEFIAALEFLIVNEIMIIPESELTKADALPGIPLWIKDTAGWWAAGKVTDSDFVSGIQYLIQKGILQVSAEIESSCSGKAMCITGKVERIVDGDTLHVDGHVVRISLTNTPERYEDRFEEATAFTRNLCPVGSLAIVDQDDKQPFDQYDRLLGKVICQGKNLNEELLENGFAEISTRYCGTSEFASEDWAKKFGCATKPYELESQANENICDSSYPDVCITPYPPDLDCKDVPFKNFRVLPPDPHLFDGDKDGIGCES